MRRVKRVLYARLSGELDLEVFGHPFNMLSSKLYDNESNLTIGQVLYGFAFWIVDSFVAGSLVTIVYHFVPIDDLLRTRWFRYLALEGVKARLR